MPDDVISGEAPDPSDAWAPLLRGYQDAQLAVLQAISADPTRLIPIFLETGGTSDLFREADLFAIYVALHWTYQRKGDQLCAANATIFLLRQCGYWSEDDHIGGGAEWTITRLGRLFDSWFPCRGAVVDHTARLISVYRRLRDAESHAKAIETLLRTTPEDRETVARYEREGLGMA